MPNIMFISDQRDSMYGSPSLPKPQDLLYMIGTYDRVVGKIVARGARENVVAVGEVAESEPEGMMPMAVSNLWKSQYVGALILQIICQYLQRSKSGRIRG